MGAAAHFWIHPAERRRVPLVVCGGWGLDDLLRGGEGANVPFTRLIEFEVRFRPASRTSGASPVGCADP